MKETAYKFYSKYLGQAFMKELEETGYDKVAGSIDDCSYILDHFGAGDIDEVGFNEDDDNYKKIFTLETQWNEALEHAKTQLSSTFFGYRVEETKDTIKIGCETFDKQELLKIIEALCNLDHNTTIEDLLVEFNKIDFVFI